MPESKSNFIPPVLLGVSVLVLVQLLSVDPLDRSLKVAVTAIAISIPGLIWLIVTGGGVKTGPYSFGQWATSVSGLAPIVTFAACFYHLWPAACFVFMACSAAAIIDFVRRNDLWPPH